ncbi:hypothetical protein B6S12_03940 [Helicobacter valdiviensis]|uniref:Uncharacterized protein n=1 Tax=Helicobacter valdiviensis TaxID=1458358 RepID=A0A2W6MYU1_9HELI|nr:hypothetical protein [Helicobacter valdiviensis]PZT48488.1 hypothetical protein B6S12_03940 [Helicobacter valdiviensis]
MDTLGAIFLFVVVLSPFVFVGFIFGRKYRQREIALLEKENAKQREEIRELLEKYTQLSIELAKII